MEGHGSCQEPCIVVNDEDTFEAHNSYNMMYEKTHLASVEEVSRILHFVQLYEAIDEVVHDADKKEDSIDLVDPVSSQVWLTTNGRHGNEFLILFSISIGFLKVL